MAGSRLWLGVTTAAAILGMAAGANAQSLYPTVDALNLRQGPGTTYPSRGLLMEGQRATVVEDQNNWYRVVAPGGTEGWVAGWLSRVVYDGDPAQARVVTDVLNVRVGPGLDQAVMTTVRQDERYPLVESIGDWRRIRLADGHTGWVHRLYVAVEEVPQPAPPPVVADTGKGVAPAAAAVQVRRGRSERYGVLDTVVHSEPLQYLEAVAGWVKVQTPRGVIGWADGRQVAIFDRGVDFAEAPFYQVAPGTWTVSFLPVRKVTDPEGLNLRSGPRLDSPVLATLPDQTVVKVVSENGDWLQVFTASGRWGWVAGRYTAAVGAVPTRLRQVQVAEPVPGSVRLTLVGDLRTAATAEDAQGNRMFVQVDGATARRAELPLNTANLKGLAVSTAGVEVQFDRLPLLQVVERSAGRMVIEGRGAITGVDVSQQVERQEIRFHIKGAVEARAWSDHTGALMELKGASLLVSSLPPGLVVESRTADGVVRLRSSSTRPFALRRSPGRLDWVFFGSGLAGKTIVVDPGHGGADPGAVSGTGVPAVREKDVALAVALELRKQLQAAGARVILTRSTDTAVARPDELAGQSNFDRNRTELAARSRLANAAPADLFVSVHANGGSAAFTGTEVWWSAENLNSYQSQRLAGLLQGELVQHLGRTDRGVKEDVFYVVTFTDAPAALAELAFVSNPEEARLLADPAFRARAATGLRRGIEAFFR